MGIDYENAFDSLDWKLLFKTLNIYNFGPSFINCIQTLYTDIESCVLVNGTTCGYFKVQRGREV